MFTLSKNEPTHLETVIDSLLDELDGYTSDDDEYATAVKHLSELYKLRELNKPKQLDPNIILTVGANLIGILAILHHEQANVIASKALGFVMKLR